VIFISKPITIKAIGCDDAGNSSSVVSFVYTQTTSGGGGGGSSSGSSQSSTSAAATGSPTVQSITNALRSLGYGQAVIDAVTAALTGQSTSGSSTASPTSISDRDLSGGSTGEDVRALQEFLNTHGFSLVSEGPGSPSNETTFFGSLTKAALAKFQAANGITPSVGYFGPKTRSFIAGM
jgi:hypothetical protein